MKRVATLLVLAAIMAGAWPPRLLHAEVVVDLQDLTVPNAGYYNGADGAGGFTSHGAFFNNSYNQQFDSWQGWSYSNIDDPTTPGFGNQYAAFSANPDNLNTYGVAFAFTAGDAYIDLPAGTSPRSARINNTTYAALSMRDGDDFAEKFGRDDGNFPDFFLLTITGFTGSNLDVPVGIVDFYLADYRFADNSQDYIISAFTEVDLSSLSGADRLSFGLSSSDIGPFGMNTPAFFALDDIVAVPEPASLLLAMFAGLGASAHYLARRRRTAAGDPLDDRA